MGLGEWCAFGTFAVLVLGLLGKGVWIAATMKTQFKDVIIPKVTETHKMVKDHDTACNPHRQDLESRVQLLEGKPTIEGV